MDNKDRIIKKQDELIAKLINMVDNEQDYDREYHEIYVELRALKQIEAEQEIRDRNPRTYYQY